MDREQPISEHNQVYWLIERIEMLSTGAAVCFFQEELYAQISAGAEWTALGRLLADADRQQLVYVVDVDGTWAYVCFPEHTWPLLHDILVHKQDLSLVLSRGVNGQPDKHLHLVDFQQEAHELVRSMYANANYGQEISRLVEKHFGSLLGL